MLNQDAKPVLIYIDRLMVKMPHGALDGIRGSRSHAPASRRGGDPVARRFRRGSDQDRTTRIGDYARQGFATDGENPIFALTNRGKKSVEIDLKDAQGKNRFLKLAATADVVIEGFRPDVMDRLGLGYRSSARGESAVDLCRAHWLRRRRKLRCARRTRYQLSGDVRRARSDPARTMARRRLLAFRSPISPADRCRR